MDDERDDGTAKPGETRVIPETEEAPRPETGMVPEESTAAPENDGQRKRRRRRVAAGVAAAAVAVGLGVSLALGSGQPAPETPEPGTDVAPTTQQATEEEPSDLDEAGVEGIVESDLAYAGEDVTAEAGSAEVTATDGHVMVTQRTDDGAEARVEASAKRAAATMSALANRTVGGAKVSDVTWVMCDPEGTPKDAVRVTPESPSVATAAGDASTDQSVADVLAGTDGWVISTDTHDALPDPGSVPQTGGTAPTAPDGSAVAVDTTSAGTDGETDDATVAADAGGDAGTSSQGDPATTGGSSTTSGPSSPSTPSASGPSSSGSPSSGAQQTHTHDWQPVYQSVWVQDSAAWDEPVYSTVVKYRCQACGALFDNLDELMDHADAVHNSESSYSTKAVQVQTGTRHHDATGHYEQQVTGYRCTGCGATK